jgi:NTP pyrophosphatase (non-canonical NTP hydrolase)
MKKTEKMMTMTIGKNNNGVPNQGTLTHLFEQQIDFQKAVTKISDLPVDSAEWSSYHLLAMMEELGEILKADKRWKTHRNKHYDPANKLEEVVDVFITAINIAVFSNIDANVLYQAVLDKINKNIKRLEKGWENRHE